MNKKKKRILILIAVIVAVLAVGGIYVLQKWRGEKAQGALPVLYNQIAAKDATGDTPHAVDGTQPSNFGFQTRLMVDGKEVPPASFTRENPIRFEDGQYTDMQGIVTFRGNNYRDTASFGNPDISSKKFGSKWEVETGAMAKSEANQGRGSDEWSGSGWTGQPIIVQWDDATKQIMNLYPDKKAKDGLVEIIYATMDGNVYFLDMEDGTSTRDKISLGLPFKGAGSLDPRGIPLFYVGAGDSLERKGDEGDARVFVCSLLNGEILYEFGGKDPFSPRIFHAYDSSALVDADTDTLLYPGENAVLYTMKLDTDYDPQAGTLSINPADEVKWTYSTDRTSEESFFWGMEDSASVWQNYMYVSDNAGYMMCIDLNTMGLVWAQDVKDDDNSSPVFEEEPSGGKYIYTAPSLHWQQDENAMGQISIYKLNAVTGEIVWEKPFEVHTEPNVSGGVQATPVLGKGEIADLIIYPVARTPYIQNGLLVALDKETGEERWTYEMDRYAWTSPVAVYAADGAAYIVQGDSKGNLFLLDGKTGKVLDKTNLGANIEASPAVYENTIVVGTRGKKIVGVTIE